MEIMSSIRKKCVVPITIFNSYWYTFAVQKKVKTLVTTVYQENIMTAKTICSKGIGLVNMKLALFHIHVITCFFFLKMSLGKNVLLILTPF